MQCSNPVSLLIGSVRAEKTSGGIFLNKNLLGLHYRKHTIFYACNAPVMLSFMQRGGIIHLFIYYLTPPCLFSMEVSAFIIHLKYSMFL